MRIGLENEERAYIAAMALDAVAMADIPDEDLQAEYDAQFGALEAVTEYNASHILVETKEAADALVAELDEGADFATLAKEHSTGPSGPNGGALGWFGAGMMVPSFEAATMELEVNDISAPVETQFGWHVIKLNDARQADIPSFEDERATLSQELRVAAAQAHINALTEAASVEKSGALTGNESLIKQLELLE